ncbi:MAG: NAD(P)H-dependent oxidoreductase subunit E [Candidatus Omnitrophica bacterium]|nr:NAD(P)H-dependent oxidoreductase subunit E [Candidatus Omnitrophota bacterium]
MNTNELKELSEKIVEEGKAFKKKVCVCCGAGCLSSGSEAVLESMKQTIKDKGLESTVQVIPSGCMGPCNQGPLVKILPEETIYEKLDGHAVEGLVDGHLVKDTPQEDKLLFSEYRDKPFVDSREDPFFKRQKRIVLENCGRINPESIEDYIGVNGYQALAYALHRSSPEHIIGEIKLSRLRGRGGAGYPTGFKWETVYRHVADQKYVVCNADEGDPGAFMDRSILEGDPHRVLEGMILAGYAIGATQGYAYIRGEYPAAIKRFEEALKQARKKGFLGRSILGSDFSFDVEIRIGAGAFVCGEETALLASIEGKRGTPRPRPPYPAEIGLWGKPTLINNVETFANIAPIVISGGTAFGEVGTPKSAGTKVFALAGKVQISGLIEVPMGTNLRDIIFEIGGGIPGGHKFKAAQTGGPSGGCIPEQHLDHPVDYESLQELGSIMGSGGLIVMDETSDMVDVARYFMEFCVDESCGKCIPCRVGTKQMFDLLTKIYEGRATDIDLATLEQLAHVVKDTSLCGLGMSAPNPLLSTLRFFKEDYIQHLKDSTLANV